MLTVQLSYKVTFACVPDAQMRTARVSDTSCLHSGRVLHALWTRLHLEKRGMALTYILLQLYHEVRTCLLHILDVYCVRLRHVLPGFRCVLHAFQMCLNVTLELSCTV